MCKYCNRNIDSYRYTHIHLHGWWNQKIDSKKVGCLQITKRNQYNNNNHYNNSHNHCHLSWCWTCDKFSSLSVGAMRKKWMILNLTKKHSCYSSFIWTTLKSTVDFRYPVKLSIISSTDFIEEPQSFWFWISIKLVVDACDWRKVTDKNNEIWTYKSQFFCKLDLP